MHTIGAVSEDQAALEKASPALLSEGVSESQRLSWVGLRKIRERLRPGMKESEAMGMAREVLSELGSPRAWHRPLIRFGGNTILGFSDKSEDLTLQENDIYFIDIGPNWSLPDHNRLEYEGDVGETFVMGRSPEYEACARTCRELFAYAQARWKADGLRGPALYDDLEAETARRGYVLLRKSDGHRLSEFPHNVYTRKGLTEIDFSPSPFRWILEVQIADKDMRFGAFYEDILA